MKRLWELFLLKVFVWSGSKLFSFIVPYSPDHDENVLVIHFAKDHETLLIGGTTMNEQHKDKLIFLYAVRADGEPSSLPYWPVHVDSQAQVHGATINIRAQNKSFEYKPKT